jgi:hypothetical protein
MASSNDPAEVARDLAIHGRGGLMTMLVSGAALVASGVSLWESTLKQPDLKLYAADNIAYTRDPWGSYEVFAVPVTISNGGARDGAVISLALDVRNVDTGKAERFSSTYTADAQYFGSSDDVAARKRRPKLPFAPLSIPGRGAYTGTILFYAPEYKEARVVDGKSKVELTLRLLTPSADGFIDRLLAHVPGPIVIKGELPNFLPGALLSGDMARLKLAASANAP